MSYPVLTALPRLQTLLSSCFFFFKNILCAERKLRIRAIKLVSPKKIAFYAPSYSNSTKEAVITAQYRVSPIHTFSLEKQYFSVSTSLPNGLVILPTAGVIGAMSAVKDGSRSLNPWIMRLVPELLILCFGYQ
jgi:hypothetical protein